VETWLGRIGIIWLIASLLVMVVLTAFVTIGSRRRRMDTGPEYLTFEDRAQVYTISNRGPARPGSAFDAPAHSEPAINHQVSSESSSLDRLLAGVSMPCDLVRLPLEDEDPAVRMAFVTTGHEARVVAVSVVDELERLGMDVEPLSYTEARAFRDGLEIAVSIYLEPKRVIRGRRPAFPGAPPDSVVIEFSVA
jgi:hypothetical protein